MSGNIKIKFTADDTHCVMLSYSFTAHTLTFDRTYGGYCRDVLAVRTMTVQPEADSIIFETDGKIIFGYICSRIEKAG